MDEEKTQKSKGEFDIVVTLGIEVTQDGEDWHEGQYKAKYYGMDLFQLCALQQELVGFGQDCADTGWFACEAKGFDSELIKETKKILWKGRI